MPDVRVQLFIIFVVTGMILIGAEIYAPGAILGIMGSIALVAAIITGFVAFGPAGGGYALVGIIITSILMVIVWMKYFPGSRIGKKIILEQDLSTSKSAEDYRHLVGKEGDTISDLRPSGFAAINGKRVDVVTQGEMITKGQKIQVVKVDGSRVVVQAI